ncbi:hypothetical protein Tcan_01863 [Toxocara canis]|uniref:Uncharacterized protein n=1 Tax=Toxocara canis TaxID=6265 RepID=A0A0B2VPD1_TOXCA|nr:hypothetical protein Tcan_01863 [Toxocara canis]
MNESVPNLLWDSAKRLYFGSPLMKVIFVCELVSSIVATVFAAVMATAILLTQVLHFNIRLLLACTCTAMAVSNVGVFIAAWHQVAMIPTRVEAARSESFLFRRVECMSGCHGELNRMFKLSNGYQHFVALFEDVQLLGVIGVHYYFYANRKQQFNAKNELVA